MGQHPMANIWLYAFDTPNGRKIPAVVDAEEPHFSGEPSIAGFANLGWAWRHPRHQVNLAEYPHVKDWYERMMARPATRRGFDVALR